MITKERPHFGIDHGLIPLSYIDGKQNPDGYFPPVGYPVVFRRHDQDEVPYRGEVVTIVGGHPGVGEREIAALYTKINNVRRIHWFEDVLGWQLRADDRENGTDLHPPITPPCESAPEGVTPKMTEIGLRNPMIKLCRPDGSSFYDGYHPPIGLRDARFFTHDLQPHNGETVAIRNAGHNGASAVAFFENTFTHGTPRPHGFRRVYFVEQIAMWQGERDGHYETRL